MEKKSGRHKTGTLGSNVAMALSSTTVILSLIPLPALASRSQSANPNISNIAAATSVARTTATAEEVSPAAEPPEKSSDKGFSTEDFLQGDIVKSNKLAPKAVEPPAAANLRVRVTVPQNADAVDQFVAYPYPMPLPIPRRPPGTKNSSSGDQAKKPIVPTQAYDPMPNTRRRIRDLILQTGYSTRTKRSVAYPQGGWRWQMAYRNALAKCRLDEPNIMTEIYPFIDAMEPLVREECKRFDDFEEERQRRYTTAYEEYQLNRNELENDAVKKGYFPIEFRLNKGWRGHLTMAEIRLGPGTWWITGTHKVAGLTYYWQQPVQVVSNRLESIDLTWQNALVIEGGW